MALQKKRKKRIKAAPRVSHTKGYYRFSKDFPSVTDSDGYRDNEVFVNSPAKKASKRRRLAAACLVVFVLAFVLTSFAFTVSEQPIAVTEPSTAESDAGIPTAENHFAFLSGETLASASVQGILTQLKAQDVDAVVIPFKDAAGYFYFKPSVSVGNEALSKASDRAANVVKEFREAGIAVYAAVSCFADDIYARNHQDEAAYVITAPASGDNDEVRSLWYNGGENSHAWLSPYSDEVIYYLTTVSQDISYLGVSGIVFTNAVYPSGQDGVRFSQKTDEDIGADEKAAQVVFSVSSQVSCPTAFFVTAEMMLGAIDEATLPVIFESGCDKSFVDANIAHMPANTRIGAKTYASPKDSAEDFLRDYEEAVQALLSSVEDPPEIVLIRDDLNFE